MLLLVNNMLQYYNRSGSSSKFDQTNAMYDVQKL